MLAPFLSVVIYGLLDTCSFFKLLVCVCLENVLLRDNPCFCPQECYEVVLKTLFKKSVSVKKRFVLFEQVLKN